jgi:uncharacterized protein
MTSVGAGSLSAGTPGGDGEPGTGPTATLGHSAGGAVLGATDRNELRFGGAPLASGRRGRFCVHPGSLPTQMAINVLDLDVTKSCNLRCTYCFKSDNVHPGAAHMPLEVAMGAVDWLIDASMSVPKLWVNLLGGEPLVNWRMVERLVPYAQRRAAQYGKAIQFGTTTNMTLLTDKEVRFARRYGMGWHCSLDGIPAVQNSQRPAARGRPSAQRAERGIPLALGHRPGAMARATITPQHVHTMLESVKHFRSKGYQSMGFAPADEARWTQRDLAEWDRQLGLSADYLIESFRRGEPLEFSNLTYVVRMLISGERPKYGCGAGRGTVGVDEHGDLWPCHRWDGADLDSGSHGGWRLGNIFQGTFDHGLHLALLDRDVASCREPRCDDCGCIEICTGGCPGANLQTTGDIYRQHPNVCEMIRSAYRHAVRVYGLLRNEVNPTFMKKFFEEDAVSRR